MIRTMLGSLTMTIRISMRGAALAAAVFTGLVLAAGLVTPAAAQTGSIERISVHGPSLEGNLEGNSADRNVIVYLPPSYATSPNRRYPVVYELHGYTLTADAWTGMLRWPATLDAAMASDTREMIVVAPDTMTVFGGSMYSNSVTTGDWEGFIAEDLVAHIDANYRTIADRESRGLTGHSMGGYGTVRLAMKYPQVFSSWYAMSSCCLPPREAPANGAQLEALTSLEDARGGNAFGIQATMAVASTWSPNPDNPPFFVDLPTEGGVVQDDVIARWWANAPLAMIHQYVPAMREYEAIAIDIGDQDGGLADSTRLHEILDMYGIEHSFEVYEGTHTSAVADRFENHVLPFFSEHLDFQ
jgi:S-formylglutathione hydrolase FrmB